MFFDRGLGISEEIMKSASNFPSIFLLSDD